MGNLSCDRGLLPQTHPHSSPGLFLLSYVFLGNLSLAIVFLTAVEGK